MERSEHPVVDTLYRISQAVHLTEDIHEAMELIIDEIATILPVQSATIELINPDHNCLEIEVSRGLPDNLSQVSLKPGAGISGWVALHGKSLNIGKVTEDHRYQMIDERVRSEMAVPIRLESGETLGVVRVSSHCEDAFGPQEEKLLNLLTTEATRALSRLWLIQQLREKADHLEVLIDIAGNIATKRNLNDILHFVVRRTLDIIPSKLCAIFLRDPQGQALVLRASSMGDSALDYQEVISPNESAIGTAFRRNKTVEIFDLPRIEENHFPEIIQHEGLASMLSCPIRFEGEALGVLNVYTDYPHRFNDSEKRIFETLASLSATAIRNAELYERIFQSEETLRRSERLTTLGLLSAEIAHEIRNPLTVIQLLFDSLTLEFAPEDQRSQDIRIIHEKLTQLNSIVSRVLSFGKTHQELRSRYNLDSLIQDTLHLVRLKLRQAKVELDFSGHPAGPVYVDVHKGQIQQAILNLLINALQAMREGGRIAISTAIEERGNPQQAVIRIHDTGTGIDPAVQDTLFDSFLTNRPDGTGLGLAIVKRILKSHHGGIQVESTGDKGTTMKLSLPLSKIPD